MFTVSRPEKIKLPLPNRDYLKRSFDYIPKVYYPISYAILDKTYRRRKSMFIGKLLYINERLVQKHHSGRILLIILIIHVRT